MKNLRKRLGLTAGVIAVLAIGSTTAAWATVAGVGEVETTIAGPNRAVSAVAQYQGTRNANGTRTLVYECAGTAVGDTAATNIYCSVSVNGTIRATSTLTTPGPASVIANTVTVPSGSIQLCYKATGYWIGGGSDTSRTRCTYVNLDALDAVATAQTGAE
jgi:hypothetical protein